MKTFIELKEILEIPSNLENTAEFQQIFAHYKKIIDEANKKKEKLDNEILTLQNKIDSTNLEETCHEIQSLLSALPIPQAAPQVVAIQNVINYSPEVENITDVMNKSLPSLSNMIYDEEYIKNLQQSYLKDIEILKKMQNNQEKACEKNSIKMGIFDGDPTESQTSNISHNSIQSKCSSVKSQNSFRISSKKGSRLFSASKKIPIPQSDSNINLLNNQINVTVFNPVNNLPKARCDSARNRPSLPNTSLEKQKTSVLKRPSSRNELKNNAQDLSSNFNKKAPLVLKTRPMTVNVFQNSKEDLFSNPSVGKRNPIRIKKSDDVLDSKNSFPTPETGVTNKVSINSEKEDSFHFFSNSRAISRYDNSGFDTQQQ